MENQVLTIEQMQELINMGVDISKASCTWCKVRAITSDRKGYSWMILPETLNKFDEDHIPTFTLQDILDMYGSYYLYNSYTLYKRNNVWWIELIDENYLISKTIKGESELECAFEMLKWIHVNSY